MELRDNTKSRKIYLQPLFIYTALSLIRCWNRPSLGCATTTDTGRPMPMSGAFALIGRMSRGFDFLEYHFNPEGLTVAKATVVRFIEKANRLYGQEPQSRALGLYVRRWLDGSSSARKAGSGSDLHPICRGYTRAALSSPTVHAAKSDRQ